MQLTTFQVLLYITTKVLIQLQRIALQLMQVEGILQKLSLDY